MEAPTDTCSIDTTRPFLRQHGLEAGFSARQLDGPRFHQLFHAVRVGIETTLDIGTVAGAALLLAPEGVISHQTAARVWGGVVPHSPDVHLTVTRRALRPRRDGIEAHHTCRPGRVRTYLELRLTDPERTFLDLARVLDLVDLVVLGDSLVAAQVTTPERLVTAAQGWSLAGARRARHAAALVRRGVESPMETRLRLLVVLAGLPEPVVNVAIRDEGGRVVYRIDLSYPEFRLGIEYEGRQHAEDSRQWGRDIARREDLDGRGWRLILVRAEGVFARPQETVDRVVAAMQQVGMEVPPGAPTKTWRRHFPGRE